MNCFAAIFTRCERPNRVCTSSITITYTRPSNGFSFVLTSGSIGSDANSGRSPRSTGMSTCVKLVMVWGVLNQ